MSKPIKTGMLCWAKMKGFAPWPGRVCDPPESIGKKPKSKNSEYHCIFFFGTNNFAWIEEVSIKPYAEHKEELSKSNRAGIQEAIVAIEDYLAKGKIGKSAEDEFDKLLHSVEAEKASKESPPSGRKSSPKPKRIRKRKKTSNSESPTPDKKARESNDLDLSATDISLVSTPGPSTSTKTIPKTYATELLDRTSSLAEQIDINLDDMSKALVDKKIKASAKTFGFLGLGVMGGGIVKNLLHSGHKVLVWNRTESKAEKFVEIGAKVMLTPLDVIENSDITFSCVADPAAAEELVFGNCGATSASLESKGYVEMTGLDPATSLNISEAVIRAGGRYLEAQIQGSRQQAIDGTLIVLAAGDRSIFDECQTCFQAMGSNSFFLGDVGNASRMSLILNMVSGISLAGLAEGLALADRARVTQKDVIEIFELTQAASPYLIEKGKAILEGAFPKNQALAHMQKDLRLCLLLGDKLEQPLPLCATTNEIYKHAKRLGYGEHDVSAVYIRARF